MSGLQPTLGPAILSPATVWCLFCVISCQGSSGHRASWWSEKKGRSLFMYPCPAGRPKSSREPQTSIAHADFSHCPELSNRHWGTFNQALSNPWEKQQLAVRNELPRSLHKDSHVHMGPGDLIPIVLCRCNHVTPGNAPLTLCSRGRATVNEPEDSKWHRPQRDLEGSREASSLETAASTSGPLGLIELL